MPCACRHAHIKGYLLRCSLLSVVLYILFSGPPGGVASTGHLRGSLCLLDFLIW